MPKKGKAKNTNNKAKHSKLLKQKNDKIKLEKLRNKARLKAIIKKANKAKKENKHPMNSQEIITQFQLEPHPEGGYFKETYRSKEKIPNIILGKAFIGNRNFCTSIYFLLTSEKFSAFHKINQDETWHFYLGTALKLHLISPDGEYSCKLIGNNFLKNEVPQFTVPAKHYFAAEVIEPNSFSFVGCTVSPGFDFRDFTLPSEKELSEEFPEQKTIITKLTHH